MIKSFNKETNKGGALLGLMMKKSIRNIDEEKKRKIIMATSIWAIGLVIIGSIFILSSWTKSTESQHGGVFNLSQDEKDSAITTAENFVVANGTFGAKTDSLSGSEISQAIYLVSTQQSGFEKYYQSRNDTYLSVRSNYIDEAGPLAAPEQDIFNRKPMSPELTNIWGYSTRSPEVEVSDNGYTVDFNGTERKMVEVQVDSTTTLNSASPTGHDTNWDGTYNILSKDFENTFTLTLVQKSNQEWAVYSMEGLDNNFVFATTLVLDTTDVATKVQDMQIAKTVKSSINGEPSTQSEPSQAPSGDSTADENTELQKDDNGNPIYD